MTGLEEGDIGLSEGEAGDTGGIESRARGEGACGWVLAEGHRWKEAYLLAFFIQHMLTERLRYFVP